MDITKKSMVIMVVVGTILLAANEARAACKEYIDKELSSLSYDDALKLVSLASKVPYVKDEFETTKALNERFAASVAELSEPLVIDYVLKSEGLRYDADSGQLIIRSFIFGMIYNLPMSAAQAKDFKNKGKLAVLVKPKPPYFLRIDESHTPKSEHPINGHVNIIIADIQCFFLMDGNNKVWAVYP